MGRPFKLKLIYAVRGKKRKATGRKCRACGKDPAPNRFFCKVCHGRVSDYVDGNML